MEQNLQDIIPISDMEDGQEGIICELGGGIHFQNRLQALNIRKGKRIKKISSSPFHGPIVVEVDKARIAIGYGMTKKIKVELKILNPSNYPN